MEQNRSCLPFAAGMDNYCLLNPFMLPFISAFQIHVQFYRKNCRMYHIDPVRQRCSNTADTIYYTVYISLRMAEGCCTRSTDTGIHTHTPAAATLSINLTLSTPTASSMSATTVMLAVAYKWCGRVLRSRNCGVDQYKPIYAWFKLLDNWLVQKALF